MLQTFFIWTFIVLPLGIAVAVMLYRSRWFILGIAAVAAAMAVIWGVLTLATSVDRWLDRPRDAALHRGGAGIPILHPMMDRAEAVDAA
jgi:hypothetical protein